MYIASQIIEIIALVITLTSYHLKTKKQIFKGMCIANILDITHYLLLNAYSGCFTKVIALVRNIFIIKKEDNQKLNKNIYLFIFIITYIIFSILTFESIYSILPFIAAIIYMIVVWNGNELQIKKIAFLCYFLWLAYNIFILSIAGTISNIISLISTYIAYYNKKRRRINMEKYIVITTLSDDLDVIKIIQNKLLNEHLVSSCQTNEVNSTYWWNNDIVEAKEYC